jgi:hypothetical protein
MKSSEQLLDVRRERSPQPDSALELPGLETIRELLR